MHIESCDAWILRGISQSQWFPENVYCLQLSAHESCSGMLPWLKRVWQQQQYASQFLSASEIDSANLEVLLGVYSLQPPSILVITMDIEPSRKQYMRIVERCWEYQGSYRIILVVAAHHKIITHKHVVELPKYVDYNLFFALYKLINGDTQETNSTKTFFDYISRITSKLTLSQACAVLPYIHVLGRGRDQFCRSWLPLLIQTSPSLFTLSQQLFARDARAFYITWNCVRSRYPDEFWLVYWSDQFWQAYCFIVAARTIGLEQSTSFTKGLPFSFIQRGWRLYQADVFAELIELMYEYDCHAKQGGLMIPYELLFNKILEKTKG